MADTPKKAPRKAPARAAASKPKPQQDKARGTRSVAMGTLSIGAVAGVLAAGVFGLLKLGKGRYVDGQPLTPPPLPTSAGTPADGPAAGNPNKVAQPSADGSFGTGEHKPSDLMGDSHPGSQDRAVDAFRPDPTAPIPEGERDAFRPALAGAAAPTLVAGQADGNRRLDAAPS